MGLVADLMVYSLTVINLDVYKEPINSTQEVSGGYAS